MYQLTACAQFFINIVSVMFAIIIIIIIIIISISIVIIIIITSDTGKCKL